MVWSASKGMVVPSGFTISQRTGWSGASGEAEERELVVLVDLVVGGGSAKVSGSMPCFFRLVSWMRAKLRTMMTLPLRNRGSMAACSRELPSP
jgi:hypothetical protein